MDAAEESKVEEDTPDQESGDRPLRLADFMAGLVVGALVGAGIALLVAPTEGARLRRRLGRGARELGERAREDLGDVAHRARRDIARRRRRLQARFDRLTDRARESLSDLR